MTDFFISLLRVLVALGIVIVLILIALPYLLPLLQRLKWTKEEKGSDVKLKRLIPLGRNMFVIELEIKGKLFVVAMSEGAVEVIYKDDVDNT
jgi:flagellar biogenesis protein FliO